MNGSGAFPPTTLSGSFPASSAPVQASTKPAKSPDSSNSHRIPTESSPVEVMEKPIQKTKEKASSLPWILPQLQNMDKLKMINNYKQKCIPNLSFSHIRSHKRSRQTPLGQATVNLAHPQTAQVMGPLAVIWKTWQRMMKMMRMRRMRTKTNRLNCQTLRSGQKRNQR